MKGKIGILILIAAIAVLVASVFIGDMQMDSLISENKSLQAEIDKVPPPLPVPNLRELDS